jgi:nucleoside-diphosphate-sugar epimerase
LIAKSAPWAKQQPDKPSRSEAIRRLIEIALIADVIGYHGEFVFDASKPDGAPQKLLNVSELARLGWRTKTPLREGIAAAYADFLASGGGRSRPQLKAEA